MPRPQFARVLLIIVEIFGAQQTVFISYQTIRLNTPRIEFDLQLYVFGNRVECSSHLVHESLASLGQIVDVPIIAIAFVRDSLQPRILQVPHPEAKHCEERATLSLLFYKPLEISLTRYTNVEVTIARENDAVVTRCHVEMLRDRVGQFQ